MLDPNAVDFRGLNSNHCDVRETERMIWLGRSIKNLFVVALVGVYAGGMRAIGRSNDRRSERSINVPSGRGHKGIVRRSDIAF